MKHSVNLISALCLVLCGCTGIDLPETLTKDPAQLRSELAGDLDRLVAGPLLNTAQVGIVVQELRSGETVYARQADTRLIPASTVKLFTAAAVLERWGEDYQLQTFFIPDGTVQGKRFTGNLIILSEGDPSLQAACRQDPLAVFKAWAEKLRQQNIEQIDGNIVVVETHAGLAGYGAGWALDDLPWGYAAPVSRCQIFGNKIRVEIGPSGNERSPCAYRVFPREAESRIVCDVRTGSTRSLDVAWEPFGKQIFIAGTLPRGGGKDILTLGMPDPPMIYGEVFKRVLLEQGISLSGHVTVAPALPETVDVPFVDRQYSPSLASLLSVMLKESDNHLAETLIRVLGDTQDELSFSSAAGREGAKAILLAAGADIRESRYADASGLSRYNLFSAKQVAHLLVAMGRGRNERGLLWRHLLPLAGQEGTLKNRFRGTPLEANLRAKTGSMSNVRALSGYFTGASGRDYAFSIMINGALASGQELDAAVDGMLMLCYEAL